MAFARKRGPWPLERPLLRLSRRGAYFRLFDAVMHVSCFGTTGSGKTTGLGYFLASAYLRAQMGFIVCTAKFEDISLWRNYAKANGRAKSLVIFDETQSINFIDYLLARFGAKGIANVIECLMRVLAFADAATGNVGAPPEQFWESAIRALLQYALPLIYAAHGTVSVASLVAFLVSAATDGKQYVDAAWAQTSFAARTLRKAVDNPVMPLPKEELETLLAYWFKEYPAITERTRSNIVVSVTTKLDRFLHGKLKSIFCGKTTLVPEMAFGGAIILLAFPVLTEGDEGLIAQLLIKYLFQVAVEGRNSLSPEHRERPVCLWMDEAHYFLSASDDTFQSTCRASRCCVVALSQNLPSYYGRLGKDKTDAVDGLLGKFNTHVFCLNGCPRTNKWASELIGRGIHRRANQGGSIGVSRSRGMNEGTSVNSGTSSSHSSSHSTGGGGWSSSSGASAGTGESYGANIGTGENRNESWGTSEQMDNLIEPGFFASGLKNGGTANNFEVTAVLFRAGANFADGFVSPSTLLLTFKQNRR
jgi:hypothetical protein